MPDSAKRPVIWLIPLSQIEEVVSAHLGPGRIRSNAAGPCLSRQVSMFLGKHVGGWSLPKIGRFYNGRHHATVLHAIAKIEKLRKADQAFDALLDVLTEALVSEGKMCEADKTVSSAYIELIDGVAARVIHRLKELPIPDRTRIEAATVAELPLGGSFSDL